MSENELRNDRSAPEGSSCAEHTETPAIATCPRCGKHACIVCWQPAVDRCDSCLRRDPTEAAPPIPWEQPERSFVARLLGTIATAWSPVRSAPAFGRDELRPALTFFALTFLPLALLWGVIPLTKTILFSAPFQVELKGTPLPDQKAIVLDVLRAMGFGLAQSLAQWAVLTAPYVSLVRAYGEPRRRNIPLRTMLFRAFLLPAQQVIIGLLLWALFGKDATQAQGGFLMLLSLIPVVLLMATMWAAARLGSGLGPFISYLVVIVPIILWVYGVGPLLEKILVP